MQRQTFKAVVLEKNRRVTGIIFKDVEYFITVRFADDNSVVERMVTLQQYHDHEVGGEITIVMYRIDDFGPWYYSPDEAYLAGERR